MEIIINISDQGRITWNLSKVITIKDFLFTLDTVKESILNIELTPQPTDSLPQPLESAS